ncbi:MAG TPA: AAA family ATPase [Myxococcota bacterium]|nr:AAA family ATPase [Myxococcota bacterium]
MYEQFFGLKEPAFSLTPDPRFLWLSETHHEGLAALYYGITRRKGFLLLTGEIGTGKTTLLRAVLDRVPADTETALILNTAGLTRIDLLKLIADEFRLRGALDTKADYVIALNAFLIMRHRAGLNTVLIIDEAQNLGPETLEEVRLISNLETQTDKLLQIVLTGQPELRRNLALPSLRQLRQRIAVQHHVQPLRSEEISSYLRHRIGVAGGTYEEVFGSGVEPLIHAFTGGYPRAISILADRCLISGYARQQKPITPELLEEKGRELESLSNLDGLGPGGD